MTDLDIALLSIRTWDGPPAEPASAAGRAAPVWGWRALAVALLFVAAADRLPCQTEVHTRGETARARAFAVTFTDTSPYVVRLDAAIGRSDFGMELTNADSVDHTVVLHLTRGDPTSADTGRVSEFRFVPDRVVVPAGSRARVRLEVQTLPQRMKGTWVGYAVAEDADSPRRRAVRQVWVVSPDVQPLVSVWVVHAWRWIPWPGYAHISGGSNIVPLAAAIPVAEGPMRTHAVMLHDSGAVSVGWVRWADTAATTSDGGPGLALDMSGAGQVGTYSAVLPFDSLYGAPTISVRYTLTDAVVWPLIVLCLGVGLAYVSQDYFTVRRPTLGLDERLAAAGERWDAIRADLQHQVRGSRYDITASVRRRQAELRVQADALGQIAFSSSADQATAYTKLGDAVQAFADGVEAWADLPSRLVSAAGLAKRASSDAATYDTQGRLGVPSVLPDADETIQGSTREWGDGAKSVEAVQTKAALMVAWSHVLVRLERDRELLEQVHRDGVGEKDESALAEADDMLVKAQARLWSANTAEDLGDKALLDPLGGLEEHLGTFAAHAGVATGADVRVAAPPGLTGSTADLIGVSAPARQPTAAAIRAERRRYDRWFLLLSFTVAVLSGLKVLYFGHPFGRPEDYLGAALWGFGTQLSLTTISDSLKRLAGATSLGLKL